MREGTPRKLLIDTADAAKGPVGDNPVTHDWNLRGVGDVNGDGTDDLVWQGSTGQVHYWPMRGGIRQNGSTSIPRSLDWSLRGVGDVNGDGTDDIVWRGSTGQVHYWRMRGGVRHEGINIASPVMSRQFVIILMS